MLCSLLICAFTFRFLAAETQASFNYSKEVRPPQKSNGVCILHPIARAVFNPSTEMVDISLSWSIEPKCLARLSGFHISYMSQGGKASSFTISKDHQPYHVKLPGAISKPENYTIVLSCMPHVDKCREHFVVGGKEICAAFSKVNARVPFHCLESLGVSCVHKCKDKNITISWQDPNITEFADYLVLVARVSCKQEEEENCCNHAKYKNWSVIRKLPFDVTITGVEQRNQYCIQVLMCPASANLNCELKHSPIYISCFGGEKKRKLLLLICCYGLVLVAVVTIYILLWIFEKRKNSKNVRLLLQDSEMLKSEMTCLKEAKDKDPVLFIAYCAGCIAIEEYVLHLTQFFRLNGIDAICELTQEVAILNHGRGVFLNKMLSEADFVLVLCTDVDQAVKMHNSFTHILNVIQNKIMEGGEKLTRYFMVHFSQIYNVPDVLRPASIDIRECHKSALEKIIRRIFGYLSYHIDELNIHKNEVHLSDKAISKVDELIGVWSRQIMASSHFDCLKKTCQKGKQ